MTLEDFLARFEKVTRSGAQFIARCPSHSDAAPSLAIKEEDGKILVFCHAGCSVESVLAALGLRLSDLFLDENKAQSREVCSYRYLNERSELLFEVVRFEPKDFRQRRPDGLGGWIWNTDGVRRVPYNLPGALAADQVIITEGERDAGTVTLFALRSTAGTCNPGGAGKWKPEYSELLRAKHIVVIPDNDEAGRKHAEQVAGSVHPVAASVKMLTLPGDVKDLTEWRDRGGTREQFERLIKDAPLYSPCQYKLATAEDFLKRSTSESGDFLVEELFHVHSHTIWQGRPKVGKSHTLLQVCFDLSVGLPVFGHFRAPRPARCVYVELEEPEPVTKARLAGILHANDGRGPDNSNLHFLSREDLYRWRILPRELLGARIRDFVAMLKDAGAEFVALVALRKFLAPGENLKDQDIAERLNEGIETIRTETRSAVGMAHHDRKSPADTVEAQGFGSTFLSAAVDAVFDIERGPDGVTRKVRAEARYNAPDCFWLAKRAVGAGEVIEWIEAPRDENALKLETLRKYMKDGMSLRKAAEAAGVPLATASRWWRGN
jgi:hypothetical protein